MTVYGSCLNKDCGMPLTKSNGKCDFCNSANSRAIAIDTGFGYCVNVATPIPTDLQKSLKYHFNDSVWRSNIYDAIDNHRIKVVQEHLDMQIRNGRGIEKSQAITLFDSVERG